MTTGVNQTVLDVLTKGGAKEFVEEVGVEEADRALSLFTKAIDSVKEEVKQSKLKNLLQQISASGLSDDIIVALSNPKKDPKRSKRKLKTAVYEYQNESGEICWVLRTTAGRVAKTSHLYSYIKSKGVEASTCLKFYVGEEDSVVEERLLTKEEMEDMAKSTLPARE
ncbi:hypothetical protein VCHA53O466_140043 [Vibrio chagasii]|nr:hypothetical protein VCHA53O466_140043 [Vibrio chagasii]